MTNDPKVCGPSIEIEKRERFRFLARPDDVGLAAGDEDKVALSHAELLSILKCDYGRAANQIVEDRVGNRRQSHAPGTAKLVMEEQGPAQASPIEHVG